MSYAGYRGYGGGGYGLGALLNPTGGEVNAANTIGQAINIENAEAAQANQAELDRYTLQGEKMKTDLQTMTYNDALIAHAARSAAGDSDQWDNNFKELDAQGVPGARQWIGRYSPASQDAIERGYDPGAPIARANDPRGRGGAGGIAGQGTDYDVLFSRTPQEQLPAIADRTGRAMDLLASVKDAPTWEAAKAQAQKLGLQGVQNLGPYNPLKVQTLYDHLLDMHDYLTGRVADQGLGVPAPVTPSKTVNVGGDLYSVNEAGQATLEAHTPKSTFVGIDRASNRPIYHDPTAPSGTPSDTLGPFAMNPRTGGGRAPNTFDTKMQAWLSVHPGDNNGALAYANGTKAMTPQEITKYALDKATADLHAAVGGGQTVEDPKAFVEQHRRQYEQDLNAAQGAAGQTGPQRQTRYNQQATIAAARSAIQRGAPRDKVIARLKAAGISTSGL